MLKKKTWQTDPTFCQDHYRKHNIFFWPNAWQILDVLLTLESTNDT